MRRFLNGLAICASVLAASTASATPVLYSFSSGSVTMTATVSGIPIAAPLTLPLTGVQVTVDTSALTLNSLLFTIPSSGVIPISPPILGYTGINIDSASVSASGGSLTLVPPIGNPQEYSYLIGPVSISGQFDAIGIPPVNDVPFGFITPSAAGSIFIDTTLNGGTLNLDGITIGELTLPGFPIPIVIKGDFLFEGVVPEPGTALLIGSGLAGLALIGRRRSPARS